ncbi:MAG: M48 family metallopeptidase [Alphaproteobacteria bacterium]
MVVSSNVYDHIQSNNIKTVLLLAALPITLFVLLYGLFFLMFFEHPQQIAVVNDLMADYALPILAAAGIWGLISYFYGAQMMLGFSGATLVPDNKKYQHLYRTVENVALAAGLPTPKIYVIEDESLNAFATGHSPRTASVAVTSGLLDKLSPLELQGVIAHEMAHIGNRDIRLNLIVVTGLGVCELLLQLISRTSVSVKSNSDKISQVRMILFVVSLALFLFNLIVAPIIRMALSRTREYAADATAAYITRNPKALADALRKISTDARVEALDGAPSMGHACIYDPSENGRTDCKGFFGWGSTHPPIEKRIERLMKMSGQMQSGIK